MTLQERADSAQLVLFSRYDLLNDRWTKAEKVLTSMHVPRTVYVVYKEVPTDVYDPESSSTLYLLGLAKTKGDWRIAHAVEWSEDQNAIDWKPIIECSAEERVIAAPFIPKLHEAVVKSAEEFVPKVDDAVAKLDEYLAACG